MRRFVIAIAAAGLLAAVIAPNIGAQEPNGDVDRARQVLELGGQLAPKATSSQHAPPGPNPYLALVPDPSKIDYSAWKRYAARESQERADRLKADRLKAERLSAASSVILVDEDEPVGSRGSNDSTGTAQRVIGFGTASNRENRARIVGALSPEDVPIDSIPANAEDDGSIPLAGETGIGTVRDGITTSARIGNGPHGSSGSGSGDFDFYAVDAVAGDVLVVDTDTPGGMLDTMVIVYDSAGELVAFNDDADGFDSRVEFSVPVDGTYYVTMSGFPVFPTDPFDSGSGDGVPDEGETSEGRYDVTITTGEVDVDFYAVRLRKGDVLGVSVAGAATHVAIFDRSSVEVMGSTQDATFIYSSESPMPGGGNAVAEHVAAQRGWHYVGVSSGDGAYDITVEAYRPGLEGHPPVQTLFLDFDGERINTGIWGGPGVRTLSPLRAFLGRWGLTNADRGPLIDEIIATTRENIRRDLRASGLNRNFRLRILNSHDDPDPFGEKNVSRVIVGGTIAESGIETIGIAQSIDPGNFGTEESALVLLDILSDQAGEFEDPSLNNYITPASDRVGFIGQAVGNIVSHEAGHFFGNWHVDQFNDQANLMDQGGNFPVFYGVGSDEVGGTADDVDVDYGDDAFNPSEGFTGTEDTLKRLVFTLRR